MPPPSAPPPPGPPPGWAPAGAGSGPAPGPYPPDGPQRTSGFAVTSLVLGLTFWCLGPITGVLAVIFGNLALTRIAAAGHQLKGRGMAIAGIVLGWIGIALFTVAALAWLGYGISNL